MRATVLFICRILSLTFICFITPLFNRDLIAVQLQLNGVRREMNFDFTRAQQRIMEIISEVVYSPI
jgi:hypothetical protein